MLLRRLKIKDFLIYGEVDIDLSQIKLASIVGQFNIDRRRSNGAGKTALLEAIRYALYDQTRSKLKLGVVRTGAKYSVVDLWFDVDDKQYRVIRQRTAEGASTARIYVNGKDSSEKVKIVNEMIQQIIGIDAELFDQIYFFKQGDQFGFVEANPSDRKTALAKVFRMDSLNRCLDMAKEKRKVLESTLQRAKGAADVLRSRNQTLPPYQELLEQEMAASANLATAQQLEDEYKAVSQCNILSRIDLEQKFSEFEKEVDDDQAAMRELLVKINETNETIVRFQRDMQMKSALYDRETQFLKQIDARLEGHTDDVEKSIASTELKRNMVNKIFSDLQSKIAVALDNYQRLSKYDTGIAGQDCPVCFQFVAVDHVEKVLAHVNSEKKRLTQEVDLLKADCAKRLSELTDLEKKIKSLQSVASLLKEKQEHIKLKQLAYEGMKSYEREVNQLTESRNKLCLQQVQTGQRVDNATIDAMRSDLKWWDSKFRVLFMNVSATREAALRTKSNDALIAFNNVAAKFDQRKKLDKEIAENDATLKKVEHDFIVYNHLSEIFGRNGMQALLIENAISVIEQFANDVLKQMQTRFIIELRTQKENKSGEMRESLDIIVYDNGIEKAFESYSGGERTLINIAIRLALSRVVGSLYGVQMNCLFLDEVLASLDAVNREEAIKIIAYLAKTFNQVFVVSHTEEILNIIDARIVITRFDDKSTINISAQKEVA